MVFEEVKQGIVLRVRVSPNSSSCIIRGIFTTAEGFDFLKVDLVSVPEKGKANEELIKFLSKKLGIAKNCFEVVFGQTDRYKKILIKKDVTQELLEIEKEAK